MAYQKAQRQILTEIGYVTLSQETSSESVIMNDDENLENEMAEVKQTATNEEYTRRDIDNALLDSISALRDEIDKGFKTSASQVTKEELEID